MKYNIFCFGSLAGSFWGYHYSVRGNNLKLSSIYSSRVEEGVHSNKNLEVEKELNTLLKKKLYVSINYIKLISTHKFPNVL